MRCFTILAIVLAFLTHCLAQNAVAAKTPRRSHSPHTKLCELILQKLDLIERGEDKKILVPLDNIINLLEIIKKSTFKASGQAVDGSGLNKELGKNSESPSNSTRRLRGRFHWTPRHKTAHRVVEAIPEVIRVFESQPVYNDAPDEQREYLESSYLHPSERRLDVDPPPYNPGAHNRPIPRANMQVDDSQMDEEPRKADHEAKRNSGKSSAGSKNRVSENEKVARSPKQQGANETLDVLKHLMGNSENSQVKAILKTLIASSQKAGSLGEKPQKEQRTRPEVVKTVRKVEASRKPSAKDQTKSELAQAAVSSDKKSSFRRSKPNTKGRDVPDEASPRLGMDDDWQWDSKRLIYHSPPSSYLSPLPSSYSSAHPASRPSSLLSSPRYSKSKLHRDDDNYNNNINVNTNTDRDSRVPIFGSRRAYSTRANRDRQNIDKNINLNSNINTDTRDGLPNSSGSDRLGSMRRALDDFSDDDLNTNINTNVNTNSNVNRHVLPRNKRRELRRLV